MLAVAKKSQQKKTMKNNFTTGYYVERQVSYEIDFPIS